MEETIKKTDLLKSLFKEYKSFFHKAQDLNHEIIDKILDLLPDGYAEMNAYQNIKFSLYYPQEVYRFRLDELLDYIKEKGIETLTIEDVKYLDKHSLPF